MKISGTSLFLGIILIGIGIAIGLFFSWNSTSARTKELRSDFLKRYAYRQELINDLKNRVDPFVDKLHLYTSDSLRHYSVDSVKQIIEESLVVLLKCDRALYEIDVLSKRDSVVFELYNK